MANPIREDIQRIQGFHRQFGGYPKKQQNQRQPQRQGRFGGFDSNILNAAKRLLRFIR